jgi:hypothetical protein
MNEQQFAEDQESVFAAMRRQIAVTPMPAQQNRTLRERVSARTRLALSGGIGALIAAAVVAVATGVFTGATPAFAITTTSGGLRITLNDFGALPALNAKLAAENLPIRVVPALQGCTATARKVGANGSLTAPQTLHAGRASTPIGSIGIEHLRRPPAGYIYIVGISSDRKSVMAFPQEIEGPVPACVGETSQLRHRQP